MVSKVGAKDFKRRVIGKIKQIDNTIKDDDLYFSQTARGYYLEYKPNYPNSSEKDLVVYQDLNGSISVHGNGNSFYPGVTTFEDISDFEDDTNFHKVSDCDFCKRNVQGWQHAESQSPYRQGVQTDFETDNGEPKMRKVVFTIDDIEFFKRKFNLSDKQIMEIFGDTESFKVIYTIIGNGNNPDRYELSDFEGNKINLRGLNGYQRGVVLSDCMAYFIDGKCHNGSNIPHGVIKIVEKEI